jgi:hypothetical protein
MEYAAKAPPPHENSLMLKSTAKGNPKCGYSNLQEIDGKKVIHIHALQNDEYLYAGKISLSHAGDHADMEIEVFPHGHRSKHHFTVPVRGDVPSANLASGYEWENPALKITSAIAEHFFNEHALEGALSVLTAELAATPTVALGDLKSVESNGNGNGHKPEEEAPAEENGTGHHSASKPSYKRASRLY